MLRYRPGTPWNVPTSSTCGRCLPAPAAPAAPAGNAKEVTSPPASAAAANPDMTMRRTPPAPGLTVVPLRSPPDRWQNHTQTANRTLDVTGGFLPQRGLPHHHPHQTRDV